MSVTLDKAARDVLSAWDHYGTAECLRGWIDIMREALAQHEAESEAEPVALRWGVYRGYLLPQFTEVQGEKQK